MTTYMGNLANPANLVKNNRKKVVEKIETSLRLVGFEKKEVSHEIVSTIVDLMIANQYHIREAHRACKYFVTNYRQYGKEKNIIPNDFLKQEYRIRALRHNELPPYLTANDIAENYHRQKLQGYYWFVPKDADKEVIAKLKPAEQNLYYDAQRALEQRDDVKKLSAKIDRDSKKHE